MNRRSFLSRSVAVTGLVLSDRIFSTLASAEEPASVVAKIDTAVELGVIPADFIGLGYEISSVARPGLLSSSNAVYVQLVQTLSPQGNIRIGGNTADYAAYSATGPAVSAPKSTAVNRQSIVELASFLNTIGWKLIWGLNLGNGSEKQAVEEAKVVTEIVKDKLLAFEIGNEVDLFSHEGHRTQGYTFEQYLKEYRQYKAAIRAELPHARFAGPDIAGKTDWVTQFAEAEGNDLVLLTHHYYRSGESPSSSFDMLFNPDPKLTPTLETLERATAKSNVPYRICETNSFSGGGRPGVSGTFGAALWVLQYMFQLAYGKAAGVNMETGVNHRGFVSSYSPIGDDEHGHHLARAEYYGMLAFAQAARGKMKSVTLDSKNPNFAGYATSQNEDRIMLTLINKDRLKRVEFTFECGKRIKQANALRLEAPALESESAITLGGSVVNPNGSWSSKKIEPCRLSSSGAKLLLPPASAAVVTIDI
jgi:hypothetical protein